ncbi:MAG: TolC family protein [Phycisphaerales bacterium]|nr:TolC family protein [Phycisphaerales bacterium]
MVGCASPLDGGRGADASLRQVLDQALARELNGVPATPMPRETSLMASPVEQELAARRTELDQLGPAIADDVPLPSLDVDLTGSDQSVVELDLRGAILAAVTHNLGLEGVRLVPAINEADVRIAESVFDFEFLASVDLARIDQPTTATAINGVVLGTPVINRDNYNFETGLRKTFRTGGTASLTTHLMRAHNRTSAVSLVPDPQYLASVDLSVAQPLLRGFGEAVNTAQIRISRNAQRRADEDVRVTLLRLAADTESAYWTLYFAWRNLIVQEWLVGQGVRVRDIFAARRQIDAMPAQYADAVSRVEQRRAAVVRARREVRRASDQLKALLHEPSFPVGSETLLVPGEALGDTPLGYDLGDTLRTAIGRRPEIEQAMLAIDDADIRRLVAENGTLPQLDLSARLSFYGQDDRFGPSYANTFDDQFVDYAIGLNFSYPIGNRGPEARLRQSRLLRSSAVVSYKQTLQNVVLDVKNALRDVVANYELIGANRSFRIAAAENLRVLEVQETITGYSPEFLNLMFQRQDQMAQAVAEEVRAKVSYRISLAELHRAMGVGLEKNQIDVDVADDRADDGIDP